MTEATPETVRGDFSGARFEVDGMRARFFRDGSKYAIETDGPDGKTATYEVAYTFGRQLLQQYLIKFPGGRLQAFSVAWDTERRRWYFLYPGRRIPPSDWLHWTRNAQNWNGMCAECHSTNLVKGYDPKSDTYTTTWSEIDVSCEAPSYAGAELKLRPMVAVPETTRQPRLFSASTSVLHDVPPRASSLPAAIPDAVLKAVLPAELARRAGDALEIKDVPLTDLENARFRIAVDASGHVTQVLPLFASTEPAITSKLRAAIQALRFKADAKTPVQWATLAFEWQNASR